MVTELPTYRGYTVDERLREFRKVHKKLGVPSIEFIPFDSKKGRMIIAGMQLDMAKAQEKER
jgi:hypothetical protein